MRGEYHGWTASAVRFSPIPAALSRSLALFLLFAFLSACSFIPRDDFTAREQAVAQIPDMPGVRFWADASADEIRSMLQRSDLVAAIKETGRFDVLAISGGAYDGAYGAGIINGWSAMGTRPRFTIVTGVSAGALLAPFAFLGPDYDPAITEAFTSGVAQVLGDADGALALLGTPDFRRQTLAELVDRFVDRKLLKLIAEQHRHGRRLLIVTTNLDAQRAVVWDMGAIAASGSPSALQLFKDVLVASASIPGIFAPTLIEVEANGHRFHEMHVDGGATTQVFIVPDAILISGMGAAKPHGASTHIWVIVNNHLTPEFEVVESGIFSTISRSFSTLIKNSAKATLLATSNYVGRERFNLTYIGDDFEDYLLRNYGAGVKPGFNTAYMRALFQYGYEKARSGSPWTHEVPLPGSMSGSQLRSLASRP